MFKKLLLITLLLPLVLNAEVKIIATVENEVISNIDVKKESQMLAKLANVKINEENHKVFFREATEYLINRILFEKKAKELSISVSEQEVEKKIKQLTQSPNFTTQMKDIDHTVLTQQIRSIITQEKVIAEEVIPYITVNNREVKDFKEQNEKPVTFVELAKRENDKEQNYLGLFQLEELNKELRKSLEKMHIGKLDRNHNIKLLDKLKVKKSILNKKFDLVKITSIDIESINDLLTQKQISCDNYPKKPNKLTNTKINNFKSNNTEIENEMYKQLLKMEGGNISISKIIKEGDEKYSILILCNTVTNTNENMEIQERIFRHKLAVETQAYIKRLRQNSIIRKND
ncbi:MAG: hypothetical protein HRK26_03840 [Rickettsiaceae bacterium H1]|nr:hypothetical protein [Rickettsiaceae bacterium H1]